MGQAPDAPPELDVENENAADSTTPPDASAPEEPNPLRSPREAVAYFQRAIEKDELDQARKALDFSTLDDEILKASGDEYVQQLSEILNRLEARGLFEPEKLPEDPTVGPQSIGKDPILLILERKDGRWRFSPSTVNAIPKVYEQLDELVRAATSTDRPQPPPDAKPATKPTESINRLRSPYHTVQFFLVKVADAAKDTSNYADAMRAMDFSAVDPELVADKGPEFVDQLAAVLNHLRETQQFDRENLPKEPPDELNDVTFGNDPFTVTLVRQADGRWRFAAATVARIPGMVKALQEQAREKARQTGEPAATAPVETTMRLDHSSAQATMNLFLTSMSNHEIDTAITCLDLSQLSTSKRRVNDERLAAKLYMIMNRHKVVVLQDVPDDPEHPRPYTFLKHTAGRIEIARQRGDEDDARWLFTPATVRSIERLYNAMESQPILPELADSRITFWTVPSIWIRENFVAPRFKTPLVQLEVWQWIGIGTVLLAGIIVRIVSALVLPGISRRFLRGEDAEMLPHVVRKALGPTCSLLMVLTWRLGLLCLDLGVTATTWAWWILYIVMIFVTIDAAYHLTDLVVGYFQSRAAKRLSAVGDVMLPLLHKLAKILIVVAGLILIVKAFGFEVGALIAGLGLGGLAIGLAAQDTIKNFFGSVNIALDRPFQVGDWVKINDTEGTVESVGLRSSRIRTFYNSEVTLPNGSIMNASVDNMGRRRYRRFKCILSLLYSTPTERLDAFCEAVREIVQTSEHTRKDSFHVYVNAFSASSIDVLLYCFLETPDWRVELETRHRLILDIVDAAHRLDVEFAFPTRTIHIARDDAMDEDQTAGRPLTAGKGS